MAGRQFLPFHRQPMEQMGGEGMHWLLREYQVYPETQVYWAVAARQRRVKIISRGICNKEQSLLAALIPQRPPYRQKGRVYCIYSILSLMNVSMSVNEKIREQLRERYNTEPNTESIELEFVQISDIIPFIDQLESFKFLKRLSLHGNRLKELPLDLSYLSSLEELDVSNNMLKDAKSMLISLRGLPNLKRLICSLKKDEEDIIINGLPLLEYYNNSKITREEKEVQIKRYSKYELNGEEVQKIAKMYDLVRNIYRKNYTNNNDRQNKIDFEEETQYTINCLHANLRENTKATDNVISALFLSCRYALYKTIESKLVNLVTDCDPDQGKILSDLLDDYSVVFSNLAEVAMLGTTISTQISKDGKENKIQLYQKELRRLRREKEDLSNEIVSLEAENKGYIDALVRISKGEKIAVVNHYRSKESNGSPKRLQMTDRDRPKTTSNGKEFIISSAGKLVTLKQLKDVIEEIQESKIKFDQKVMETKLPRQTMYEYLFTFLNQKYGLKTLTIEWASSIVSGIQKYSSEDNDVSVFGKILRNECEEEFRKVQAEGKVTVMELLKMHIRGQMPYKSEGEIKDVMDYKTGGYISSEEAEDIVKYIYSHSDAVEIMEKLNVLYNIQIKPNDRKSRDESLSKQGTRSIKYSVFLKCILDHQLKNHEKYLRPLTQAFHAIDNDADGIINEKQFSELLHEMCEEGSKYLSPFLNIVDPHEKNLITYSEVCRLFSNYPEGNPILSRFADNHR